MSELKQVLESGLSDFNVKMTYSDLQEFGDQLVEKVLERVVPVAKENAVEQLLTKQEVMEEFVVCHTTLYNWEKAHVLIPVKVGRKVNYRLADVQALCAKRGFR